jgi:hypothetical protein
MKWNPFVNGLGAVVYVWSIGFLINHISRLHHDTPDNLVGSVSALSLLVCSAAIMAFLFFYRPVMLTIENRGREGAIFFLKTLGTFAITTAFAVSTLV